MTEKPDTDENPYIENPELDFDPVEDLTQEEAEKQVRLLREAVRYHDYRYYVENDPVISDRAYDELYARLEDLEDEFGLATENSPTQRVGGEPVDEFETVEHVTEMLSLSSSDDEDDVRKFDERVRREVGDVEYNCEPKFDGLSVEVVYESAEYSRAVTRGDGVEGDDVTRNVRTIRSVPLSLPSDAPDFLAVRGEIYIPKDGFQSLNEKRIQEGNEPFANPRNAAAGSLRQLDPNVVADRPLDIFFYSILDSDLGVESHDEAMEFLSDLGFETSPNRRIVDDIDGFIEYRDEILERRDELNYDVDGVVAKVNDYSKRGELGVTSSHPRWAFAYKFPAKTGETTVERIVVQVGRTGKLTPVALLEPVDVKGVTISRATLHNESQARQLGVSEGARVRIKRAGDVIPEVVEVTSETEDREVFEMPDECPVCGSDVVREGEYHYCTGGVSCPAQLRRGLEHFGSKDAMDIQGLGEKIASVLVDEGIVEEVADLYRLEKDDLVELDGFGEKSAQKLVCEIDDSKTTDLSSFLTSLGIRHVGSETARRLSDEMSLEEIRDATVEELRRIDDVGEETAESIHSFFEGRGGDLVDDLLDAGVTPQRRERSDELEGLKIVFTGSLDSYTRDEATDLVESHGGDVTSSVSGETDYLVVGEDPGARKTQDADEHGVETLDEGGFEEKVLGKTDGG
ncbi:NAD-dependent DNA ligase LigA [Halorutilales archaeon Cl-col2-1]